MIIIVFVAVILFYILTLIQTSFLAHFPSFSVFPNLTIIAVLLINLLEKKQGYYGLLSSLIGGFFLDIFSGSMFVGFYMIIFLFLSLFIKFILKSNVQIAMF